MGKELTLHEMNDRYPSSTPANKMKKWFTKLITSAKIDQSVFYAEDKYPSIPINGKQYEIYLSVVELNKLRKFLNRGVDNPSGVDQIYYDVSSNNKPIIIEYMTPQNKLIFKFRIDSTSKKAKSGTKSSGTGGVKPSTQEQEKVTLKIFEELLKNKNPKWDKLGFKKLAEQELSKLYKDINHQGKLPREWYSHFELQFNEVRDITKLPNNRFDVYDYDAFMNFIEKIIVHEGPPGPSAIWPQFGKISKKDSWNPADVWLVKSGGEFDKLKKQLKTSGTIKELNSYLKYAFGKNIIVGISLKKSSGKPGDLHYELNNLEAKLPKLPVIELDTFKIDLPFDNKKKVFEKTTNVLIVTNNGKEVGLMRTGTNTTGPGNNTYEFKGAGTQTAQMGKVPKDLMLKRFQVAGLNIQSLPTMQEVEDKLPRKKGDQNYNHWKMICKNLKGAKWLKPLHAKNLDDFPDVMLSLRKRKIQKTESFAGQVVLFAHLLYQVGKKKGEKEIHQVMEDFFYFAQKKGKVFGSEFGPFGKLY